MKNIFLLALSLVYNYQMYLRSDLLPDLLIKFFLSFVQFYLLILYLIYSKLIKFIKYKIFN